MSHVLKFTVPREHLDRARQLPSIRPVVQHVDVNEEKSLVRIVSREPLTEEVVRRCIEHPNASHCLNLVIDGMHCQSCEVLIEREWKELSGVQNVNVSSKDGRAEVRYSGEAPSLDALDARIKPHGYHIQRHPVPTPSEHTTKKPHQDHPTEDWPKMSTRPTAAQLLGLVVLVFLIGTLLSKLGLLKPSVAIGGSMTLGAAFFLGLFAASSSCLAVSGGLLISSVSSFQRRFGGKTNMSRMRPVFLFVVGRIASYTVLGGVIGLIGSSLLLSPTLMGLLTIVAAVYMLVMGLDMLHLAPNGLKALLPRMPKSISHRVFDVQKENGAFGPFFLGAATFFLPCGFTQALQLYALTTGSAITSGLLLGAFALGTAPSLFALGWASSSLKGKAGTFFLQLSGVAVVVLGLWNIQNGLTIAGYPLSLPNIEISQASTTATEEPSTADDPNVEVADGEQVIRMTLTARDPYYYPSDTYTVAAGVP